LFEKLRKRKHSDPFRFEQKATKITKVVFRGNKLGLRCLRFLLLEVIRAIRVIRGKKLPVPKIFCHAGQSSPKEKVKARSDPGRREE
jgi:hypothetical protein